MASTKRSPTPERTAPEDPDTAAARKELGETAISEKPSLPEMPATNAEEPAPNRAAAADKASSDDDAPGRESPGAPDGSPPGQIASPKKKRVYDEVEGPRDTAAGANGDFPPADASTSGAPSRTDRSEPEKKRPRDLSSKAQTVESDVAPTTAPKDATAAGEKETDATTKDGAEPAAKEGSVKDGSVKEGSAKEQRSTSESAFKSSGMSGFASQASPFLQAGSTKPLSSFASASTSQSPFGMASTSQTSIFGGTAKGSSSPFGQMGGAPKPFGGSAFSSGFGSSLGGAKLTGFGKPGESLKSSKPARPFGAPVSEDEDNEDGEGEAGNASDDEKVDSEHREAEEENSIAGDDKKKTKLQRVAVDTGEAGEATLLQVRAKLFSLDKASSSWKERGAGNLKINVPLPSIDIDEENGTPIPGSFDASGLEDAKSQVVRLIMRQDSTHRVILNTVVIPAMKFQEKSGVKATCILFTAIEDEGAVSIQIKMSQANAKSFLNEVEKVQRELQSV